MEVIGEVVNMKDKSEYEQEMAFLKEPCPSTGISLHRHLCDLVHYALATRAAQGVALDTFEESSRVLRARRAALLRGPGRGKGRGKGERYEYALRARRLLKPADERHMSGMDDDDLGGGDHLCDQAAVLDTLDLARRCGLALDPEESLAVALAVKRLAEARTLIRMRFWGKVLARDGDYTVLEAELTDDELDRRADLVGAAEQAALEDVLNRKVYLVCGDPCGGGEWRELPPLRPAHVLAARARRAAPLSGRLDAQVRDFPGAEAHLLHAQLVRIAAACSVSPAGAFTRWPPPGQDHGHDQDLAEDELGVVRNTDWLGAAAAELADPALWVHHSSCLLQSGRPADLDKEEGERSSSESGADPHAEEEEDEDEEEEEDEYEDEEEEHRRRVANERAGDRAAEDEDSLPGLVGDGEEQEDEEEGVHDEDTPALLTSLAEDAPLSDQHSGVTPAWTSRLCSPLLQPTVLVRSLRWPGAVAFCSGRKFGYIYFGWAMKASSEAWLNCGGD